MFPFPFPIPPIPPIFDTIGKIAGTVLGLFSNNSGSDDIVNQQPIIVNNEKVDEIVRVNNSFRELLDSIKPKICEMEKEIIDDLVFVLEEYIFVLTNIENMPKNINISRISSKLDNAKRRMKGTLHFKMTKKISLDNTECQQILAMQAGDNKKIKLDNFTARAFEKSLEEMVYDIKKEILYISDEIREILEDNIDLKNIEIEERTRVLESLQSNNNEEEKINVKTLAITNMAIIDNIIKILD